MNLFADSLADLPAPLAHRMRPVKLDDFKGQEHLLAQGKPLRALIESDRVGSLIFWGPQGCGKTTLAYIISRYTKSRFEILSAVSAGVKELRQVVNIAKVKLNINQQKTILLIDELHRFSKVQQDAILPYVEEGIINLIGATTENPIFEVISALRSRCRIYQLKALSSEDIRGIIKQALADKKHGLADDNISLDTDALENIVVYANGDARAALNALEVAANLVKSNSTESKMIDRKLTEEVLQQVSLLYDKAGDEHYDHASAYQKSMRGSDPDAAIYWLGKMIACGEDPRFIARRLMVTAAEDVGNADPRALILAAAAAGAAEKLGWPEARIPLSQATLYVACAPKSNSTIRAIDEALCDIQKQGKSYPVPLHLKSIPFNAHIKYKNPHYDPPGAANQTYLPTELLDRKYYVAENIEFETRTKKTTR